MRAVPNLDFTSVLPEKSSLDRFVQMLRKVYTNVVGVINGNLSFGDGTNADNISGTWISAITPNPPNTDFVVTHNLGRIPVGYIVMTKSAACDIYTGSVVSTKTQLTLRGTINGVTVVLFII